MSKTGKYIWEMVIAALCVALGIVLPLALHGIPNAGKVLLPMHLTVLLCGLLCGPAYGLSCGLLTPLLSSLVTSMPAASMLPSMMCELAVYGFVAGMLVCLVRTRFQALNVYTALIGAMLVGRIVYGVMNALVFQAGEYSFQLWLTASFVAALPGIILQLVLLPLVVLALRKAKLAFQP